MIAAFSSQIHAEQVRGLQVRQQSQHLHRAWYAMCLCFPSALKQGKGFCMSERTGKSWDLCKQNIIHSGLRYLRVLDQPTAAHHSNFPVNQMPEALFWERMVWSEAQNTTAVMWMLRLGKLLVHQHYPSPRQRHNVSYQFGPTQLLWLRCFWWNKPVEWLNTMHNRQWTATDSYFSRSSRNLVQRHSCRTNRQPFLCWAMVLLLVALTSTNAVWPRVTIVLLSWLLVLIPWQTSLYAA